MRRPTERRPIGARQLGGSDEGRHHADRRLCSLAGASHRVADRLTTGLRAGVGGQGRRRSGRREMSAPIAPDAPISRGGLGMMGQRGCAQSVVANVRSRVCGSESRPRWSPNGEHLPLVRYAFEDVSATALESESAACHEILDCARHQNLAGPGQSGDAGSDVNGKPADIVLAGRGNRHRTAGPGRVGVTRPITPTGARPLPPVGGVHRSHMATCRQAVVTTLSISASDVSRTKLR